MSGRALKVRCDMAYASFCKETHKGRWWIGWHQGVMTIVRLTPDLVWICAE